MRGFVTVDEESRFQRVYQIDGGIVRYGEEFGDDSLWEGSLYVFDKRLKVDFSDHPQSVGQMRLLRFKYKSVF